MKWRTAAAVIRGSPVQPEVVITIKTKGRTFTSSYEEAAAMESPLTWTSTNGNHPSIITLFCKDRKSLCEALISSNPPISSIWNSMNSIYSFIFVQWIPDHSAIPGNELDDKAAKEVTTIATNAILPIFFQLHAGNWWNDSRQSTNTRTPHASLLTPKGFSRLHTNQEQKTWRTAC